MITPRPLETKIREFSATYAALQDRVWHSRRDRLRLRGDASAPSGFAMSAHGGRDLLPLSEGAWRQLCGRFGMTADLVTHLVELHPNAPCELLDRLLWKEGERDNTRLRFRLDRTGAAQAVLSEAYVAFDRLEVLQHIERTLGRGWMVDDWQVDDEMIALHCYHPDLTFTVATEGVAEDSVHGGWYFTTGERGGSALTIRPRLIRTNGRARVLFEHPIPSLSKIVHRDYGNSLSDRLEAALRVTPPLADWANAWRQLHKRFLKPAEARAHLRQWKLPGGASAMNAAMDRWSTARPTLFRLITSASAITRPAPSTRRRQVDAALGLAIIAAAGGRLAPTIPATPAPPANAPSPSGPVAGSAADEFALPL